MNQEGGLWTLLPSKVSSRDQVTGHKLALLVLVSEYCRVKTERHLKPDQELWTHTSKQCRDFAITALKLLQSPDMSLADLLSCLDGVLHPNTMRLFSDSLRGIYDAGVAGIMDYIPNLDNLLADPTATPAVLHKSSVLGLFVRRMLLALDKLNFSALVKLHQSFRSYYDAEGDGESKATQRQADLFLAQQITLMQVNEKAALPPPQLQQKLRELVGGNPALTEAHYVSFLNCLSVKEYFGAVESLRQHFDRASAPDASGKSGPMATTASSEDSGRNLRYASLHLAMLHAKMGHDLEARAALREAVTLAQDANDVVFLQHALAWHCRLDGARCPEAQLRCSVTRASELGLCGIASLGIQALTRVGAEAGSPPAAALELLSRSEVLNFQHPQGDTGVGTVTSQKAALWTLYGFQRMAHLQAQLLLQLGRADQLRTAGVVPMGEPACLALRSLAWALTLHGQYNDSRSLLDLASTLFPAYSACQNLVTLCRLECSFHEALHKTHWPAAEALASGIRILNRFEGDLCTARLLLWQGHLNESLDLVDRVLEDVEGTGDGDGRSGFEGSLPHFKGRCYLLKAEILIESSQPVLAIPVLCEGLTLAEKHHLSYLRSSLVALMAEVQFEMGLPGHACTLLEEVVTVVLSQGGLVDVGQLYLLLAKCRFKSEGHGGLESAVQLASSALKCYETVESKRGIRESAYWLALLCDKSGMEERRNEAARTFRRVDEQMAEKLLYEL
ncbi:unnamed protein product [Ixodes hexagonus]